MGQERATPFSERIYSLLRARIAAGEFIKDGILPPERALATEYETSRPTIRKALSRLGLDGLVECRPGVGYILKRKSAGQPKQTRSRLLGLILAYPGDPSTLGIRQLERQFTAKGYSVLLGITDLHVDRENECIKRFLDIGACGFVVIPAIADHQRPRLADLIQRGFPIVALGEPRSWAVGLRLSGMVNVVDIDNTAAMILNVSHLYDLGHRRIGIVQDEQLRGIVTIRQRAFMGFLQEKKMDFHEDWIVYADPTVTLSGNDHLRRLMDEPASRPTALICQTDALARHVIHVLGGAGVNIPGDVSVSGFGVIESGEKYVSSVCYSAAEYASEVVRSLIAQMEGNKVHRKTLILAEMKARRTTAPLPLSPYTKPAKRGP